MVAGSTTLRDALSLMLTEGSRLVVVVDDGGEPARHRHPRGSLRAPLLVTGPLAQTGPVIPEFGEASDCVQENRLFCPEWVRDNWATCSSRRCSTTSS